MARLLLDVSSLKTIWVKQSQADLEHGCYRGIGRKLHMGFINTLRITDRIYG